MEELGLTELSKVIKEKEAPSLGDWIKLNVGGAMFETSRATLTRVPDSLLGRMFDPDSSLPPARMQDGAFLLDADPAPSQSFSTGSDLKRFSWARSLWSPPSLPPGTSACGDW